MAKDLTEQVGLELAQVEVADLVEQQVNQLFHIEVLAVLAVFMVVAAGVLQIKADVVVHQDKAITEPFAL